MDWTATLIKYMLDHGYESVEANALAEQEWTQLVKESYEGLLLTDVKSWFTGYNSNVDGHDKTRYLVYFGGAPEYRKRLTEIAEKDYEGFQFS